jgi:hypothetical protein
MDENGEQLRGDELEEKLREIRRIENQRLFSTNRDGDGLLRELARQRVRQMLTNSDQVIAINSRVKKNLRHYFPDFRPVSLGQLRFWRDYSSVFFRHLEEERYRQKLLYVMERAHYSTGLDQLILDDLNCESSVGWTAANITTLEGVDTALDAAGLEHALRNSSTTIVFLLLESIDAWNDDLFEKLWAISAFERVARRSSCRTIEFTPSPLDSPDLGEIDIGRFDPTEVPLPLLMEGES